AIHIDVLDADIHRILGEGYKGLKDYSRSRLEFETALELKPKDVDIEAGLADVLIFDNKRDQALLIIESILKRDPDHDKAKELKKKFAQ
ncbi:MAG: tetratricopeptide repeat protein, partial [Planctomycetes bacterium]|nr:tetratricopeptide repeat protein [Planctomycetota bacterium]